MLRILPNRQSIVSLIFLATLIVSTSCNSDHTDRPQSARDAASVINGLDVAKTENLALANVYLTRFMPGLESTSQDSLWMAYSAFIDRFIAANGSSLSRDLLVDGNGPFAQEGIIARTDGEAWWLEADRQWQYDRFASRSDSSLHEWLRIQQYPNVSELSGLFRTVHRLEYWADHFPNSPMISFMQGTYRDALNQILATLDIGYDPWRNDYKALFDQLHLHAGLDAVKVVTQYISSQQRGAAGLNPNAFTDTLRYRPRSWVLETE